MAAIRDAEFGPGIMLDDMIAALTKIRQESGNIHIAVPTGLNAGYQWYGQLDPPYVTTVKKNYEHSWYMYDPAGEQKVCIIGS
jgi:hypothetical protein